jgi:hypothetical protein
MYTGDAEKITCQSCTRPYEVQVSDRHGSDALTAALARKQQRDAERAIERQKEEQRRRKEEEEEDQRRGRTKGRGKTSC